MPNERTDKTNTRAAPVFKRFEKRRQNASAKPDVRDQRERQMRTALRGADRRSHLRMCPSLISLHFLVKRLVHLCTSVSMLHICSVERYSKCQKCITLSKIWSIKICSMRDISNLHSSVSVPTNGMKLVMVLHLRKLAKVSVK